MANTSNEFEATHDGWKTGNRPMPHSCDHKFTRHNNESFQQNVFYTIEKHGDY